MATVVVSNLVEVDISESNSSPSLLNKCLLTTAYTVSFNFLSLDSSLILYCSAILSNWSLVHCNNNSSEGELINSSTVTILANVRLNSNPAGKNKKKLQVSRYLTLQANSTRLLVFRRRWVFIALKATAKA